MSNNQNQGASIEAERRAIFQAFSECLVHGDAMTPIEIADRLLAARRSVPPAAGGDLPLLTVEEVIELAEEIEYEDPETGRKCFDRLGFAQAVERKVLANFAADRAQRKQADGAVIGYGTPAAPASAQPAVPLIVREAIEATFEQRPGHLIKVAAAVRAIGEAGAQPDQRESAAEAEPEQDPLYEKAVLIVRAHNRASLSLVQRTLVLGYNRTARLFEAMEKAGVVSAHDENGHRTVIADKEGEQ